jgi:N-acetyl-anhydromuramyl-L-alanine amidase AmpD
MNTFIRHLRLRDTLPKKIYSAGAILLLLSAAPITVFADSNAASTRSQEFAAAAQEFKVPESVLLALSYNESHWQAPSGMSDDGGYGLMDLRTEVPQAPSGSGLGETTPQTEPASFYTLDTAASLLNVPKTDLETNDTDNIRGAAAVLAQDAEQLNGGSLPTTTSGWYGALAAYSGATTTQTAQSFASAVFATIQSGESLTTADGQALSLPAANVQPDQNTMAQLHLAGPMTPAPTQQPECPASLHCQFIPAYYGPSGSTSDPTNYGNYDLANRPSDGMPIKYIFIHDTEGSYQSTVAWFQNPASYTSAQYVIASDGSITQMVPNKDISWGVANWYDNMHGINIEHEGYAAQGATWYTPISYQNEATLVRWLAAKYNIPLNREHILGHDNIPTPLSSQLATQHWDPGPYWNWTYFMDLVQGKPTTAPAQDTATSLEPIVPGEAVTIAPNFATNQPTVTDCQTGTCVTLPPQGANFVYLYTQPSTSSPLLSDPYLHPDNSPGTTADSDWGDKASTGEQFVVAKVQGPWTGIYYAGQVGWFYNPIGSGRTATPTISLTVTPRPGLASVPVYGQAYPEAAAYPVAIPVAESDPLYTIPANQSYPTTGENLPTDYYNAVTYNYSAPDDHVLVVGKEKYYQIWFNHRIMYVKASDVVVNI